MKHWHPSPTEWLGLALLIIAAVLSATAINASQTADHNSRTLARIVGQQTREIATLSGVERAGAQFTAALRTAATGQCERVQGLRDRVNADSSELHDIGSVLTAVIAEPSLLRALTPADALRRTVAVARLRVDLGRLRFEPPTDCANAVANPLSYRRPAPRPFPRTP